MAFRPHQLACTFVGHPCAAPRDGRPPADAPPTVLLAPGSRPAELQRHWPVLRAVAQRLQAARPEIELVVSVAETVPPGAWTGVRASFTCDLAGVRAHAAVAASGTATLELAAAGIPQVVVYAVHPLTWAVGRALVHTPHLALPNLLARAPVVPEHVQSLDPAAIAADVLRLLDGAGSAQVHALRPALAPLEPNLAIGRVAARVRAHCRQA
jgi:lipid-A-disaccharide synthase